MEWFTIVSFVVIYFIIGGFVDGLFDLDLGAGAVIWPLILLAHGFMLIVDMAYDIGNAIREFITNR
jgi:hypothetical protein